MPDDPTGPLVGLLHRLLGGNVLGIHLHGSAVLAGLRPHSDVDVLVVVRDGLPGDQRSVLVRELMKVSGGPGRRPVELVVVRHRAVRPWRYPPACEFLYGEWLREEYERGYVPVPGPMPDLAPLITMARDGDTSLYGPSPRELLDAVPPADLRRAIAAGVPELLAELGTDTRNVLLTLARIRTTLATGAIVSKDAAADWALPRLAPGLRAPLEWARAGYLGVEVGAAPEGVAGCAEALVRGMGEQGA
ncbi:aminoglycoside adenylyltransferase domain-containing protein [Streptomyces sp. NPDC088387]|uniref:aminoglycoside adenylyltransferase domain-containing protein n=1 Tax=Streptomyces sp. NPDC088387 TaxID=3365859 RepID=UPI00382124D1